MSGCGPMAVRNWESHILIVKFIIEPRLTSVQELQRQQGSAYICAKPAQRSMAHGEFVNKQAAPAQHNTPGGRCQWKWKPYLNGLLKDHIAGFAC